MNRRTKIFIIPSLMSAIACGVLLLLPSTHSYQMHMFFASGGDFLADFLNPLNSLSLSSGFNPYHSWLLAQSEQGYPPLGYFIYLPFVNLLPRPGMTLHECFGSPQVMIVAYGAVFLMIILFFVSIYLTCRRFRLSGIIAFILMFSGQVLFGIERGNSVLFAVAGIALFLSYHDSERSSFKSLAAFGLAVAVALKVVPVLFGVLWLNKRDFRYLVFAGLTTLALTLIPLLFSDHTIVENILQLMDNIALHEEIYANAGFSMNPGSLFRSFLIQGLGMDSSLPVVTYGAVLIRWACRIVALAGLACAVKATIPLWQRFFLLAASQILIVSSPQQYVLLYFFPALIAWLAEENPTGDERHAGPWCKVQTVVFYLLLVLPFPLYIFNDICMNHAIASFVASVTTLILIGGCVKSRMGKNSLNPLASAS